MKLRAKIQRIGQVETKQGRVGDYKTLGQMLGFDDGGQRQSLYGTLFGTQIDTFAALDVDYGSEVEFDLVFTTAERNGWVSNYIELRNPRKL